MNAKILSAMALLVLAMGAPVLADEPNKSVDRKKDAETACMEMMQGSGVTDEGRKAMHEFMQSPKAPQAMNNMMEMARRMDNGDPMLGMTKMMEMMGGAGSMGPGMTGGDASHSGRR